MWTNLNGKIDIAFIGGSGLYKIPNLKNSKWIDVKSNFGTPSSKICIGKLTDKMLPFFPGMELIIIFLHQLLITGLILKY